MKKVALIGAVLSLVLLLGGCTANNQTPTDTDGGKESVTDVTTDTQADTDAGADESEGEGAGDSTLESNDPAESEDEGDGEAESKAYIRVSASGTPKENGAYILLGSWPQSEVTDTDLTATLNGLTGTLPTEAEAGTWTSYAYYIASSNATDFMWYQDVALEGETYRGVYFTSYRPKTTASSSSASNSQQDEHGYTTGTVYWFKWEPLKWRILKEENGNALLLCERLIDAQAYQNDYHKVSGYLLDEAGEYLLDGDGNKISANNYAYSAIRAWLSDTFYATAFTDLQKEIILLTTVDNSAASTSDATGTLEAATDYACGNTEDYVFLMSESEITKSDYGFDGYAHHDPSRLKKTTAYANCQGAQTHSGVYEGNGWWWLRSPHYQSMGEYACEVYNDGYTSGSNVVNYTTYGICPALWIKL